MDYKEDKKNNICHPEFISGSYQHENNEEILWKTINFSQNNKMLKQVQHDMNVSLKKHIAFTHLVNPLRSDLSPAKQSQSPARSSLTGLRYSRPSGFTLAETLIALTVLGIVAAITVPQLVRRQIEAANRAKLKKVMTIYDGFINRVATENDIKSTKALKDWGEEGGICANQRKYFKPSKLEDGGCKFKTSDGVWWNVTDVTHPVVALKKGELDNLDSKTTFKLLAHFGPNGELRVDDLQWELTQNAKNLTPEEKENLEKLYAFANNEKNTNKEVHDKSYLDDDGIWHSVPNDEKWDLYMNLPYCDYDYGDSKNVNCKDVYAAGIEIKDSTGRIIFNLEDCGDYTNNWKGDRTQCNSVSEWHNTYYCHNGDKDGKNCSYCHDSSWKNITCPTE